MTNIEESSGNVNADLGMADADEMLVKAQLATRIGEILKSKSIFICKNNGLMSFWPKLLN